MSDTIPGGNEFSDTQTVLPALQRAIKIVGGSMLVTMEMNPSSHSTHNEADLLKVKRDFP